ncbi:cytochrome c3 family protein [Anaeromyxobacter diazotrophicus]|uniref:Cytochrome c n=1 Tax=Anaeromyxobacter diazotrophicus TaxID=2590199 RepID=A0A7I9VI00_9BACT|nr:cytochrome c3 family protein [Anaeromyxobacter diazotrophicus]GEJ56021.1 cytochrome c [Anaeromyxobacter diazotrophicus]
MRLSSILPLLAALAAGPALAAPAAAPDSAAKPAKKPAHPDNDYIKEHGYDGPRTCEVCHPGTAKAFLETVHWKHASKVPNVKGLDPKREYGMQNRIYTFCNGNDIVNNLKEIPANADGKTKLAGCNTCHPGNHLSDVGSTGAEAEQAVDCLICHASKYDYSKRKPSKTADGKVVMGQDRSVQAALTVGKPSVKSCMTCHESAGGGQLIKRGFAFDAEHDAHAAKGMTCVDCHAAKDHKIPTGFDPNNWANDGVRVACGDCHGDKPHGDPDYDAHTAKVACQTCHIPTTGGAVAKDFTKWTKLETGFYDPGTIKRSPSDTKPVYAWFSGTVEAKPHFIGPVGSRADGKSKIFPFKIYQGRAFYDRRNGQLLSMDFAQPMATGDALAGVASAAKTLGLGKVEPVAGWQTIYFANSHLVTKAKALTCDRCHVPTGVLDFQALGYSKAEIAKRGLQSPQLWFDKLLAKELKKEE